MHPRNAAPLLWTLTGLCFATAIAAALGAPLAWSGPDGTLWIRWGILAGIVLTGSAIVETAARARARHRTAQTGTLHDEFATLQRRLRALEDRLDARETDNPPSRRSDRSEP